MVRTTWLGLGLAWVLSLLTVGTWVHAQDRRQSQAATPTWPSTPFVLTGENIGFRVVGFRDGGPNTPIGTWMIRSGAGQPWIELYMSDPKIVASR